MGIGAVKGLPQRWPVLGTVHKVHLRELAIDANGYACNGEVYFGVGEPVFEVFDNAGEVYFNLRASSRNTAKNYCLKHMRGTLVFFR